MFYMQICHPVLDIMWIEDSKFRYLCSGNREEVLMGWKPSLHLLEYVGMRNLPFSTVYDFKLYVST